MAGLESVFVSGRLAFIPYVMAGDPDLDTTRAIVTALARHGADAIELGVPYGDPLADGPAIAAAGARALAGGVNLQRVLAFVGEMRASLPPLILFTYYNLAYQFGLQEFARAAAGAGAAGVIIPDISLEESEPLRLALGAHAIDLPLLVAPSTPAQRAARIAEQSGGFVYVVSRLGVTGAGKAPETEPLRAQIGALRAATKKPLAVGFGISTRAQVDAVRGLADGVIVGSALVDAYAGFRGEDAARRVGMYIDALLPST
ncbi:MAG TPA: tryptophan synthase subunit alpha [Candidatus Rubrimentiphilum sp.]|nr:tryptophan synthase subunit alpha [Candidatus Rubrimentiphilum sp.]